MRVLKRVVRLAERGGVVVGAGDPDAADAAVGAPGSEWRAAVTAPPATKTAVRHSPEEEDALAPLYEREDELFSVALERLGLGAPRASASLAVRFALALSGDDAETARRGFESLTAYLASLHRFGPDVGAALLPMYGAAEFPQAFARLAAVRGATCALQASARAARRESIKKTRTGLVPTRPNPSSVVTAAGASAVSRARRRRRRDDAHSFAGEENAGRKRGGVDSKSDATRRGALDLARHRGGGRRVRFLSRRGSRAGGEGSCRARRAREARSRCSRPGRSAARPPARRSASRSLAPRRAPVRAFSRKTTKTRAAGGGCCKRPSRRDRARLARRTTCGACSSSWRTPARCAGPGRDAGNAVGGGDEIRRRFRRGKRGKRRVREGKRNASGTSARVVFRAPLATARDVGIVPSRSRARRRANLRGVLVRASEERRDVPRAGRARGLRGPGRRRRGGGAAAGGGVGVAALFSRGGAGPRRAARRARRTGGPERETRTRTRWTRCFGTYRDRRVKRTVVLFMAVRTARRRGSTSSRHTNVSTRRADASSQSPRRAPRAVTRRGTRAERETPPFHASFGSLTIIAPRGPWGPRRDANGAPTRRRAARVA